MCDHCGVRRTSRMRHAGLLARDGGCQPPPLSPHRLRSGQPEVKLTVLRANSAARPHGRYEWGHPLIWGVVIARGYGQNEIEARKNEQSLPTVAKGTPVPVAPSANAGALGS